MYNNGDTICPAPLLPVGAPAPRAPPSRRNVAVVSHAQYVLTVTAASASRVRQTSDVRRQTKASLN